MALIRNIHTAPMSKVDLPGVQGATISVMVGREDNAPHFALRSIEVEPGGNTPHHAHDYEHEVYVVSGNGHVLLEGTRHPIKAGDVVFVPANEEHEFTAAEGTDEPLKFLCVVPVEQNCGGEVPGS
ncbi:MAG: cupin domain-containing protein [Phycisphaerales bacterium]|nr:cupin domain-containing protein [Phycisphaerales bacterium]